MNRERTIPLSASAESHERSAGDAVEPVTGANADFDSASFQQSNNGQRDQKRGAEMGWE